MRIPALLALLAAAAALPAASAHALTPTFEVTKPAGGGPELDELLVRASCDSACTIRLKELSALRFRTRGGVAQLPNGASGPLRGTKRVAAGAAVTFSVAVPAPVQQFALSAFRAQEAVVGNLVATVQPATGGAPVEAVRQVVAVVGSTPSPYPASPLLDVLRLPARPAKKPGRKLRWELSIRGTQTSRWSYDRSTTEGACKMLDAGSGTQKLTFRSTRRFVVEQVIWRTGELKLRQPDSPYSGAFVPVQVDAVRDSREQKGADGDCGGGGDGDDLPVPACERRGSREIEFVVGYFDGEGLSGFASSSSWDRPSTKPDCPYEHARELDDSFDILNAPYKRETDLTEGGVQRLVVVPFEVSDTTDLGGGKVVTKTRFTLTFRLI
ncbi:MAG TPA: hypothetical protein VLK58_20540 [Conexibacter sp.]|nr:hypothetical protein [Conexibacter sp.]